MLKFFCFPVNANVDALFVCPFRTFRRVSLIMHSLFFQSRKKRKRKNQKDVATGYAPVVSRSFVFVERRHRSRLTIIFGEHLVKKENPTP